MEDMLGKLVKTERKKKKSALWNSMLVSEEGITQSI